MLGSGFMSGEAVLAAGSEQESPLCRPRSGFRSFLFAWGTAPRLLPVVMHSAPCCPRSPGSWLPAECGSPPGVRLRLAYHRAAVPDDSDTLVLLRSWHGGDQQALQHLLERDLPFVRAYVASRMGPLLRARLEVDDLVQDAMVVALRYTPRFLISEREQFRSLLARITENVLRDNVDKHQAMKRDAGREQPMLTDSMLHLDPSLSSPTRPSQAASRNEEGAWLRLAIDLLPHEDRWLVIWHEYEDLPFEAIGERLGLSKDATRMRFLRLLPRLAKKVELLKAGRLTDAMSDGGRR